MRKTKCPPLRAFTLIEILVAVLLLSLSLAAMATLWGLSRKLTERSRDTAEKFAVARQEVEREKANGFKALYLFITSGVPAAKTVYYDQNAKALGSSSNAYYKAVSTFSLVSTGETTQTGDRQLVIQTIEVSANQGATDDPDPYKTTVFYSAPGG